MHHARWGVGCSSDRSECTPRSQHQPQIYRYNKKEKKRRGRSDAADAIGCKGKVDPFCNPAFGHLEAIRTWEAGDAIWETGRCYDELRDEEVAVGVLDCRDSASCVD